ncbi:DUF6274 family protein [Streptomyces pristinaespiralis]|jgi:hypothetical protein|uniref:Uncharacterized protein n=2 Tax=Streptomyces pristinaespiralis TaxID=38300 RepID=B5H5R0_STRE2|nr:DUF6274 family protein [Streptomyces pristinaespiralis]ALC22249.1 hypothetical protein SPRI_3943 [Streptomyces pristinaespiralis]EDY62171.1 conserved hypothetical protein [Streptomyces pristinaespiralis ATCC 25486]QMU15122.1 hypothetical protein H3L99_17220 [Streptomyces pristinaespiralis]
MAASTARRYETRALLRAHLSAASGYRHLTRSCPICHRLLRLAMERPDGEPSGTAQAPPPAARPPKEATARPPADDKGPTKE